MGMVMTARMLTPDEMAAALSSPEALDRLLHPDDGEAEGAIDVDKAWHGIHWLLTGSPDDRPPAARKRGLFRRSVPEPDPAGAEWLAVLGGDAVNEEGTALLLRPEQVAAVAEVLAPLDRDALGGRVDLLAMEAAELYPQIWEEPDVYDEYLGPNYEVLRDFYLRAAAEGSAVLRRELNGLVAAWHHRTGQPHGATHAALRKECGGPAAAVANADTLRKRIDRVREWAARRSG